MKAFLIARVSTEDQVDALPAQVHRLLDYAKRRAYEPDLIEFQESAYKGDRDEFKAIISKIQTSTEPVAVVFDKIDRYTRDSSAEEVRILQGLYRSGAIELHFPSDNLVIHKDSPATDIMRLGLGIVLAQYYSDAISNNVKRRLEQMLRDGECIGLAPYGYKNVTWQGGKKSVEIDAMKADAVRSAYEWYASGSYSIKLVTQKLHEAYGLKLSPGQLDKILKNPFYMGVMLVKGKLYPHKYDRIITEQVYEQAKQVREGYHVKPKRWAGLPYPYRGLISCAECGCRITFEKKKGLYIYGHCTQYKGKHNAQYILEEEFTKQLQKVIQSIAIPEEAYREVELALRQSHEDKKRMRTEHLARMDAEIEKYQTRIERVYEDYLDDVIPKSLYERKFEEYRKAQKSLQNKRINIEQVEDDYYSTAAHLLSVAKQAPTLFEKANFEQKRSLINLVLSNLQLDGDLLLWELKKPFDTMAFCNDNNNWLGR
jgi:site-specific DNA recombinase